MRYLLNPALRSSPNGRLPKHTLIAVAIVLLGLVACTPNPPTPTDTPTTPTLTPTPTATPTVEPGPFLGISSWGGRYLPSIRLTGCKARGWSGSSGRWCGIRAIRRPNVLAQIREAHNRGFKILLSVKGDRDELRADPEQYFADFANYLGAVAAGGPDAIEVWNEQNIDREWPSGLIDPEAYTDMLSAAYGEIKDRNDEVLVVSGAPGPTGFFGGACTPANCDDRPFLEGMAAAGAAEVMDCVGIHYNEGVLSPDARSGDPRGSPNHYTRYYHTMVETYQAIFPTLPLCFTELGYLSADGYGPLPPGFEWAADTSVADQAEWLARAAELSDEGGWVRLMIVWNVDATNYGADPQAGYAIIRPDGSCPACDSLGAVMPSLASAESDS